MTTEIKTKTQAIRRVKQLFEAIQVFEHAVGQMEVDGWFGYGNAPGLSTCKTTTTFYPYETEVCADGGPVCAGIAIYNAAHQRCALRRWNKERTTAYVNRHLDLFVELADIDLGTHGEHPQGSLRSIPHWNDRTDVTFDKVKDAFGVALKKLAIERVTLGGKFSISPSGRAYDGNTIDFD